jgi:hypothetical protein
LRESGTSPSLEEATHRLGRDLEHPASRTGRTFMTPDALIQQLKASKDYFDRSTAA